MQQGNGLWTDAKRYIVRHSHSTGCTSECTLRHVWVADVWNRRGAPIKTYGTEAEAAIVAAEMTARNWGP